VPRAGNANDWCDPAGLITENPTRAYASLYVDDNVFFANAGPPATPSAPNEPERTVDASAVNPDEVVHPEKSAFSKLSANSGVVAAGVVTGTAALTGDTFPAASLARTVYWCIELASTVLSV
jgi:hypothetical protein